jgi:16S rRNA (guanine966-N2)-methyltransferase
MRIIGGSAGGRTLKAPRGVATRPTSDKVRQAIFNILIARMDPPPRVLDLYAGSGALGLEALSRGAASALFVESDYRIAAVIARNIKVLGLSGATLRRGDVVAVLLAGTASPVDLVLADPPYDIEVAEVDAVLAALARHGWAREGTVVAVERAANSPALTWPAGWSVWPERVYGDTRLELAELA